MGIDSKTEYCLGARAEEMRITMHFGGHTIDVRDLQFCSPPAKKLT